MADIEARYEFRIWGETLSETRARLERRAMPVESASRETYLVSRTTNRCNAKIRGNLLDIKILSGEYRGLERWKPLLKAGFPLDHTVLANVLFPSLEIQPTQLSRPRYELSEFFSEAIGSPADIAIVELSKTRLRFSLGPCLAEFTLVVFKDRECQTVAVESTDPVELLRLIDALELADKVNLSYVRYIKRTLRLEES
jgi:exopolyphosphatase / guanosine-5'-triphosphate,3'-diphosphate pyrophosphatase